MPSVVVSSFISLKSLKLNRINHKRNLSNTVAKHFLFPPTDIFKMYFNVIYFITPRELKKKNNLQLPSSEKA